MSNNTLLADASADTETEFWNIMIPIEYLGKTRVMIGMVVSGFCVLSFLIFLFWRCINKIYQDDDTQKLSRKLLPSSIFIMIIYFGAEFASAVMLVIGKCRIIQYYPTLIALDFIGLFADSTLLSFLLITFANRLYENVGKNNSGTITIFIFYCWVLGLIALANPPSFLWKGVMNMIGADGEAAFQESGGIKLKILSSYTALNVSFYGVYLGGVLGLAWISFRFMRKFRKGAKTLKTLLLVVVVSLVLRTIGKCLYSILFVLQARTKSPQMVLIHTIFYGLLSVVIYGSIMVMLRTDGFQKGVQIRSENAVQYQRASQNSLHEDVYKPPKHINVHTSEIVDVPAPGPQPWRGHAADYYDYPPRAH